jgi:hypothetical protein
MLRVLGCGGVFGYALRVVPAVEFGPDVAVSAAAAQIMVRTIMIAERIPHP